MPFKIFCACGVALLAGDDLESLKVACPECGNYTLLPSIPDPYKLPSNAEMVPFEEEVVVSTKKEKTGTVRKRSNVSRGGGRGQGPESEMSNTNVILIIVLVVVVFVIIFIGAASAL